MLRVFVVYETCAPGRGTGKRRLRAGRIDGIDGLRTASDAIGDKQH